MQTSPSSHRCRQRRRGPGDCEQGEQSAAGRRQAGGIVARNRTLSVDM